MKRIVWILPLSLVATACSQGGGSTPQTYTADPSAPRYDATGQRRTSPGTTGLARAGNPAVAAPRATPPGTPYYTPPPQRPTTAQPVPQPPPVYRTLPTPPPMARAPIAQPPSVRPQNPPAMAPRPSMPASGTFRWVSSLREAQDAARATGRMVFIETGRPACGNCEALRNNVIPDPTVSAELGAIGVGYYTDCDQEPNGQAFVLLATNLPGAATLPLVGFFTPDLRWVHGYSGGRNVARFRQEIATARAAYQRLAALDAPASPVRTAALPTDAQPARTPPSTSVGTLPGRSLASRSLASRSLPDAELADVTLELSTDRMLDADSYPTDVRTDRVLADAPRAQPEEAVAVVSLPVAVEAVPSPSSGAVAPERASLESVATERAADAWTAAADMARGESARAEADRRHVSGSRSTLPGSTLPVSTLPGTAILSPSTATFFPAAAPELRASLDVRAWAQAELVRAATALSTRDYGTARTILAEVRTKAAGAPEAREAAKGDAAIWNLRKIEGAPTADDAGRLRARAKSDLEATVFESLFA